MRIGLVRHFKVNHPFPTKRWVSRSDLINWFSAYDNSSNIQVKEVDLGGIEWKGCYSSTMIRAIVTANHIYKGEIIQVAQLRELDILHRLSKKLKLPFLFWGLIVRMKSFSSNRDTDRFKSDILEFVDKLMEKKESDTLIVSHWFVMRVIRQELIRRGLTGDNFKSNEYGTLYVYRKEEKDEML